MSKDETCQYLLFTLGDEQFALALHHVKEIVEQYRLTPVPMMPDFVRGLLNVRGRVVPVIDLKARLGRQRSQTSKRSCIVIIEVPVDDTLQAIGVFVDAVDTVLEIGSQDIEPPPRFGAKLRIDFLSGMAKVTDKFITILAIDKVLSLEEMDNLIQASEWCPPVL